VSDLRLGLLTDLHFESPSAASARSWINPWDPAGLATRIRDALEWFGSEGVDAVAVTGDLVQDPTDAAFDEILATLSEPGLPVLAVAGNHDWDPTGAFARCAARAGVVAVSGGAAAPWGIDGADIERRPPDSILFWGDAVRDPASSAVVLSHFPVLGCADVLASAGLPYPGDLANRDALRDGLIEASVPLVVLGGHIHARITRTAGVVLQMTSGALIEPPFDASIISMSADRRTVRRVTRRLGERAHADPVFVSDDEAWTFDDGHWRRTDGEDVLPPHLDTQRDC
jgi:3',5'-cyclic AMP phosphodiesterase CpdA